MSPQTMERTTEERLQNGISLKIEGRYEDALEELRAVLEIEPEHLRARREIALVFGFTGLFDESIEELRQVVARDPSYLEARVDLAMTLAMIGERDEAKSEFEAVLEIDPGNAQALRQMVYFE